ncbi:T9SS type A sorting domain-containing protein [Marivirga sp.]|uniref:T9SS type A sorting domain-containing protein n=1 Tax=Marivirga sp. TaxID=2018662 RepID=UPI0025D17BA5|nr:T9SS type A sorting domain-containing protein [Marivirga sp.]
MQIDSGSNIAFYGDVINNGTLTDESALVALSGSNALSIRGDSVVIFNNLEINNTSTSGISLQQKVHIRGEVIFTQGIIYSTATNYLVFNNLATATAASNNSFVSGPVFKTGNQAFTFPIGNGSEYAPVAISAPMLDTDQFKAEYFAEDAGLLFNPESKDDSLHHISGCEYWQLDRTAGISEVNVTLSWATRSCGVGNLADLRIAHWDGANWKNEGNGGTTGSTLAGTIISSNPLVNFSPFTLASISKDNTLPITLLSFEGICLDYETVLKWQTASESDNDYFTLEYSTNTKDWEMITEIAGSGNSNSTKNYSYTFKQAPSGNVFYRLKQTDFNGDFEYFPIVEVKSCVKDLADIELKVFPVPTTAIFNLSFNKPLDQITYMKIYNTLGRSVFSSDNFHSIIDLSDHPMGIYFVQITLRSETITKKIMIER